MREDVIEAVAESAQLRAEDVGGAGAEMYQVLLPDGTLCSKVEPRVTPEEVLHLYRLMVQIRALDDRMMKLQRQGRIGFYMTGHGEEAAILGSAYALEPTDWILPCYREYHAALLRGYSLTDFICQLLGNARDITKGRQMPIHIAIKDLYFGSVSSPIGTQIPQAVGMAWAAKLRGEKTVAISYFGDGATSSSEFHVGANFAGVFKAPCILFCRNNGWAISTPTSVQSAVQVFAQKALAYGIDGVRVDGNDLLAVIDVTRRAAERARAGLGATFIEAVTYRRGAHSSSDDPSAYRQDDEAKAWDERDPLLRLRRYLERKKLWSQDAQAEAEAESVLNVQNALQEAEAIPPPPVPSIFEDVFADVPWHLQEQRDELLAYLATKPR